MDAVRDEIARVVDSLMEFPGGIMLPKWVICHNAIDKLETLISKEAKAIIARDATRQIEGEVVDVEDSA
jgi:hypothetical protein